MLSDMIPTEALELMVAKIYTESAESGEEAKSNNKSKMAGPNDTPPSTVVAGFLRFLQLLSTHDWARYVSHVGFGTPFISIDSNFKHF